MKRTRQAALARDDDVDGRDLRAAYLLVVGLLAAALLTALIGWVGGLGPPYREYAYDTAEDLGIAASFLLLPFALRAVAEARRERIRFLLRLAGWLLCAVGLLLPALLLANTWLDIPGSDFGCGSLTNPNFDDVGVEPGDDFFQRCQPVRAERRTYVVAAAVPGALSAAWLGFTALRPSPPKAS